MTLAVKTALNKLARSSLFDNELYFIGGTALAYHLNHRIFEDIDFISPTKLPYAVIESTMLSLGAIKQKDMHESVKAEILNLDEILSLSMEVKNISLSQDLLRFISDMKEQDDDEFVYLDENLPVAIRFEDLQKRLINNIRMLK